MDEWEMINRETVRLAVPGGWLYRVRTDCAHAVDEFRWEVAVVFVPCPTTEVTP